MPKTTFVPKYKHAKAFGTGLRISQKAASVVCRTINYKPLNRAKRLLEDLKTERRSLGGKYYTKAVAEILNLVNSCEKNAEHSGLDMDKLFVHACAHKGGMIRRRRRKGAFGNTMKNTHLEVILIEMGREAKREVSKKKIRAQLEGKEKIEEQKEKKHLKEEIDSLKEEQKELKEKVEHHKEEHKKESE
jgi:ribosomal protein L22